MIFRFAFLSLFFYLSIGSAKAGNYVFDYNNNCKKAYQQIMALDMEQGAQTLKEELTNNPSNLIPYYLTDYSDCLYLLFNGDNSNLEVLKSRVEDRIKKIEQGPKNNPWYKFCLANIHFHWTIIYLRLGDNFKAASRFRKSFVLLKENNSQYPKFSENKVLWGLEKAVAGAIPENYKWLAALIGIKGNVNKGVAELATYINADNNDKMHEEAMIYYTYLRFYLQSNPESAWRYINGSQFDTQSNLMRLFVKANLALNYRKAETAKQYLKIALSQSLVKHYPIFHYEMAEAQMAQLDYGCIYHYKYFLEKYKGNHFVKDAYFKIAQCYYLQSEKQLANQQIVSIKNKGQKLTDADKQAFSFAEKPNWPLPILLEIKLLIDGGYYHKALNLMQTLELKNLFGTPNILEYHFRYGRILEELSQNQKAIECYDACIEIGKDRKEYFAARAALQKAFIYERQGDKSKALLMFKTCLAMRNHDAQNSIDQLAKAGINRLEIEG